MSGELVGLYQLDARYVEVVYANVRLGLIDLKNTARCSLPRCGTSRWPLTGRAP